MATDAVAGWLAVVDDDLRQVVNNLYGPMPSLIGAAYHCQQAAEKLVKAVLVEANTVFPKTHDIAALVGLLPSGHRLKAKLHSLEKLTPYGVAYRYPAEDDWDVPSTRTIEAWKDEIDAIRSML
ncbi:MAG TPA: HEPN domain-containing protein [Reyranella sp.]